jgi:hypothetical protein
MDSQIDLSFPELPINQTKIPLDQKIDRFLLRKELEKSRQPVSLISKSAMKIANVPR